MRKHSDSFITLGIATLGIAIAFAAGFIGSGCKRARHTGSVDVITIPAGQNSAIGDKSAEIGGLPPSQLARQQLEDEQVAKSSETKVVTAEARPKPEGPMCYVETFHHKPTPDDTDEETSSHHKNQMTLAHSDINSAHICVRVNGIPVKFAHKNDRKGDQILIGAIAGPTAKITVSYCVGKLICPEVSANECTIPKDEFMDALGGGSDDGDGAAQNNDAQWGGNPSDAKLNADVKKELSDIDGMGGPDSDAASARGPASIPVFKGWVEDQDAPACSKQAS